MSARSFSFEQSPDEDHSQYDDEILDALELELSRDVSLPKKRVKTAGTRSIDPTAREEAYRRLADPVVAFAELAPRWIEKLERFLQERNYKAPVFKALKELELHFRGLTKFYCEYGVEFERLISGRVFILKNESKKSFFFHRDHPDFALNSSRDGEKEQTYVETSHLKNVESSPSSASTLNSESRSTTDDRLEYDRAFLLKTRALWNRDLARALTDFGGKCSAHVLLARLENVYPGLLELFNQERAVFCKALDVKTIAIVHENRKEDWFYLRSRPEMSAPDLRDVQTILSGKPLARDKNARAVTEARANVRFNQTVARRANDSTGGRVVESASAFKSRRETETSRIERLRARFSASSERWLDALEERIHKGASRPAVLDALEELDAFWPGLVDYYLFCREELEQYARTRGIYVDLADDGDYFLHETDPALRKISGKEARKRLDIGVAAKKERETIVVDAELTFKRAESFDDVAEMARLNERLCEWALERSSLLAYCGEEGWRAVKGVDRDLSELASKRGMRAWTNDINLSSEQFKKLSRVYRLLSTASRTLGGIIEERALFSSKTRRRNFLLVVEAQRLVKAILFDYNIGVGVDRVLFATEKLLDSFSRENYGRPFDLVVGEFKRVDATRIDALEKEALRARAEYLAIYSRRDGKAKAERSLTRVVQRITESDDPSLFDWIEFDKAIETLCVDFAVKPSATFFRKTARVLIDRIPDELDKSESLCQVVQQIELYDELTSEQAPTDPLVKSQALAPEIALVRKLYARKTFVFVGGIPQDHMRKRLERDLNVTLVWDENRHGHSLDRFAALLNDPEVVLFIVYIPWCSHKHSEELCAIVQSSGKGFVRVRKGTGSNVVASAICDQIST